MDISLAFLVVAFLAVVSGVLLVNVPAGLIVAGVLFGVAGVAMLPRDGVFKREKDAA